MANIDHVSGNYLFRVWLSPLAFPIWCLKYLGCWGESRRCLRGTSRLSTRERYEKFFSLLKTQLFLRRKRYTFVSDERMLQVQAVFVIDEDIAWESIALLRYISERHGQRFPFPLLGSPSAEGVSPLWNLIDVKFGGESIPEAIGSGRSFLLEKKLLAENAECSASLKSSHLPIVPIHCFGAEGKHFYRFGRTIKPSDLVKISSSAFASTLEDAFRKLREIFLQDIRKSGKKGKNTGGSPLR